MARGNVMMRGFYVHPGEHKGWSSHIPLYGLIRLGQEVVKVSIKWCFCNGGGQEVKDKFKLS